MTVSLAFFTWSGAMPSYGSSATNAASSFSLSYTTRLPSMCAARNRFSLLGSHRMSDTAVALMMPWTSS